VRDGDQPEPPIVMSGSDARTEVSAIDETIHNGCTAAIDVLFLGPPGTGKSHLAQALGHTAIQQGYQVRYREAFVLREELADATLDGTRREYVADLTNAPLPIIDDLAMRKLPITPAEDSWKSSCAATAARPPCSPRTGRSRTGESCSVTRRLSPPCSIGSSNTATSSRVGRRAGV
jgi:hypothetical protein